MGYDDVAGFVGRLRQREAVTALALEFLILTAARTGEVIGARWAEVDAQSKVWTIPAVRMKAGKVHRVPLVPRALDILEAIKPLADGDFLFPGQRRGKPLSNMAMAELLRRMGVKAVTVHGFRWAFRDWAGERTAFPRGSPKRHWPRCRVGDEEGLSAVRCPGASAN